MLLRDYTASVPVDIIRTLAIILVILVHAATRQEQPIVQVMYQAEAVRWFTMNTYNAFSAVSVPLFVMLSGALLLQPNKIESIRGFLKKRAVRLGLPFIFWGTIYFLWRFFINNEALSASSIVQGIVTGPYYHFWFLYMLAGLYLITPVLRVLTAHAERRILRYFLIVIVVGTSVVPLLALISNYSIELKLFAITGWIGYFMLGYYTLSTHVKSSILYVTYFSGTVGTVVGMYVATALVSGRTGLFFVDYLSATVVLASASLFILLLKVSPNTISLRYPLGSKVLHFIGSSTLAIYLFHVIILESLQKGFLGFQISLNTMNPIIEVPLITMVTFFITVGIIWLLKRIPQMEKLIG